jgi:hypothetical protein
LQYHPKLMALWVIVGDIAIYTPGKPKHLPLFYLTRFNLSNLLIHLF